MSICFTLINPLELVSPTGMTKWRAQRLLLHMSGSCYKHFTLNSLSMKVGISVSSPR